MQQQPSSPSIRTIPSSDTAFAALVERVVAEGHFRSPRELGSRLRRLFPRVLVRERALSGEAAIWYVYRDGAWRPNEDGPWWARADLPRVAISHDGLVVEANPLARSLLGMPPESAGEPPPHFTEFVAPGALADSSALFEIVRSGREIVATVLVQPRGGEIVACDLRAWSDGELLSAVFRLADGIEIPAGAGRPPVALTALPAADVVFTQFAGDVLAALVEATPEALEFGLRRLFPHASVRVNDDGSWTAFRDRAAADAAAAADARGSEWWLDASLPRIRYDGQGLILEANEAAQRFLGRTLVGHHWHEFVTPTASDVVSPVLEMIRKAHAAISRFRMPRGDGTLVEFDSYTTADGDTLTTVMRPI